LNLQGFRITVDVRDVGKMHDGVDSRAEFLA
jgi:hypothetical protein